MASEPTVIKKYANRRLYHTGTSTYVTLEDLAQMVKKGDEFVVIDAKTGEDITRAVLGQIIFEQESHGQHLLPLAFLRQLIRFYGDSIQTILPSYLESSLAAFARNQGELREQMTRALKGDPLGAIEEQTRRNMEMFSEAMRMWLPFGGKPAEPQSGSTPNGAAQGKPATGKPATDEIEALRRQLGEIQKTIDTIAQRKP